MISFRDYNEILERFGLHNNVLAKHLANFTENFIKENVVGVRPPRFLEETYSGVLCRGCGWVGVSFSDKDFRSCLCDNRATVGSSNGAAQIFSTVSNMVDRVTVTICYNGDKDPAA